MAIAEIYETELVDLPKACAAYGQAAEWFQGEESSRFVEVCLIVLTAGVGDRYSILATPHVIAIQLSEQGFAKGCNLFCAARRLRACHRNI